MVCCGDPIPASTTTTAPVPPPGANCCLRTRYICQCIGTVDTWVLDVVTTACVDPATCVGGQSCTDTEFVSEIINGCICGDPLPPLPVPTCDPHCCTGDETTTTTTTTTTTMPPPVLPCIDCGVSQPSMVISGLTDACAAFNQVCTFKDYTNNTTTCTWRWQGTLGLINVTYTVATGTYTCTVFGITILPLTASCVAGSITGVLSNVDFGCGPTGVLTFG